MTLYELMKKYIVHADSVKDFCEKYHRRGAYHDRGAEYMEYDRKCHEKELKEDGYTMIPKGSSVTGEPVTFYGCKAV